MLMDSYINSIRSQLKDQGLTLIEDIYSYEYLESKDPLMNRINLDSIPSSKKVWFISDTHLGHANLLKYEPLRMTLGGTIDTHDQAVISKWNAKVQDNDLVIFLGDFALCGTEKAKGYFALLKGIKLMVLGNHDKCRTRTWWTKHFTHLIYETPVVINRWICSHEPIPPDRLVYWDPDKKEYVPAKGNVHGHTHSHVFLSSKYRNVCCECIGFEPIQIKEVTDAP